MNELADESMQMTFLPSKFALILVAFWIVISGPFGELRVNVNNNSFNFISSCQKPRWEIYEQFTNNHIVESYRTTCQFFSKKSSSGC